MTDAADACQQRLGPPKLPWLLPHEEGELGLLSPLPREEKKNLQRGGMAAPMVKTHQLARQREADGHSQAGWGVLDLSPLPPSLARSPAHQP